MFSTRSALLPPGAFGAVFDMWGTLGPDPGFVTESDAPLLIAHGEEDAVVPVSAALSLEARAALVGLPHEVHIVPGAGHGFDIFTEIVAPGETMFDRFVAFFFEHVAIVPESPPPAVPANSIVAEFALIIALLLASAILIRLPDPDPGRTQSKP